MEEMICFHGTLEDFRKIIREEIQLMTIETREDKYLNRKEAAKKLGMSTNTLRKLEKNQELKPEYFGNTARYLVSNLEKWRKK